MTNKSLLLIFPLAAMLLSGCVGKANHPQCQSLKAGAAGSQFGAALTGRYIDQVRADMDERQYERCEEMFDLVNQQQQYQQQLQETEQEASRERIQVQEQAEAEVRKRKMLEALSAPEMQKKMRNDPLKDLVSCARGEGGEKIANDVKVLVEGACRSELDRRVDSGKVSRAKVDKLLNKQEQQLTQSQSPKGASASSSKLAYASLQGLVDCEHSVVSPQSGELLKEGASSSYQCELEIDRRVDSGVISRAEVNKMGNQEM
ncbi:hypothetical protein [Citrobacter sp. U14242]|uniref:hypothetical protein n=1 Tax=Citrobacter sp. U14242 TaxID=3390192 RepID=UPI00397C9F7A